MINNLIVKSYLNNLLDLSHSWYPFRRSDDNGCNIIKLGLFGWCLSSNWWNSDNDGSVDYFLPKVIKICYKTVNIAFAKKNEHEKSFDRTWRNVCAGKELLEVEHQEPALRKLILMKTKSSAEKEECISLLLS